MRLELLLLPLPLLHRLLFERVHRSFVPVCPCSSVRTMMMGSSSRGQWRKDITPTPFPALLGRLPPLRTPLPQNVCVCVCVCVCVWILFRGLAIYFAQVLISGKFPSTISPLRACHGCAFPHCTHKWRTLSRPRQTPSTAHRPLPASINYPKMATWLYLGHCVLGVCVCWCMLVGGSVGSVVRVKALIHCRFVQFYVN